MIISLFSAQSLSHARIIQIQSPQIIHIFLRPAALSNAISLIRAPFAEQIGEALPNLSLRIKESPELQEIIKKIMSSVQNLMSRGLPPILQDPSMLLPLLGFLFGRGDSENLIHHLLLGYIAAVLGTANEGRSVTEGDLLTRAGEIKPPVPLSSQDLLHLLREFGEGGAKGFTNLSLTPSPFKEFPTFLGKWSDLARLSLNGGTMTTLDASSLPNLEALSVSGNNLTKVDPSIASLQNLKLLNLSANRLSSLPNSFASLSSLLFLDMRHNQLESMPRSLFSLQNMQALLLDQNGLKKIPAEIEKLSSLRVLSIAGNPLETISESLARLPNLETLIVSAEQWKKLPEELLSLKGVQILVQHNSNPAPSRNDSIVAPYQGQNNLRNGRKKRRKGEKSLEERDQEESEEREAKESSK